MRHLITKIFLFFILCGSIAAAAQNYSLPSPSFSYSRAAAMGGAFTAVEDGLESILFNPAGMSHSLLSDKHFSVLMNPIGAAVSGYKVNELSSRSRESANYWLGAAGILLKSISISNSTFQLTVLLSEDIRNTLSDTSQLASLNVAGLLDNYYHAAALRISLAKQVSIGASALFFNHFTDGEFRRPSFGSSYGILMKPSLKMSAGISYFYFPAHVDSLMLELYGLTKGTINAGISYSPIYQVRFALDFRNLSSEDASSSDQLHAGLELLPTFRLALRAGYSTKRNGSQLLSLGFGIGDFRPFHMESDFVFSNILLNYAIQAELDDLSYLKHSLSFLVRF